MLFNLDARWTWVVSFTTRPLYPQGKRPWYPLDRRLDGPHSQSGCGGEEKNFHHWPTHPPHSLVSILTGLSWLPLWIFG